MAELGQQIPKLMAALTKAGQDNIPSSAPGSPQERGCGRGHSSSNIPSHPNSHNGRSGHGQTTPACSLLTGHGTGGNGTGINGQSNPGTNTRRGHNQQMGPKFSPILYVPGVGPHGQGMPYPSDISKPAQGEPRECDSHPAGKSYPSQQ